MRPQPRFSVNAVAHLHRWALSSIVLDSNSALGLLVGTTNTSIRGPSWPPEYDTVPHRSGDIRTANL